MKKRVERDKLYLYKFFSSTLRWKKWCFGVGFLLFSLIFWSGCIEEVEGCLDNTASNFNPTADNACADCCDFPIINLKVAHRVMDSLPLIYNTPYTYFYNIAGDSVVFNISKVKFYLSDFRLENDTKSVGVEDTITLTYQDGTSQLVEDNFLLISRDESSFNYQVGTFRSVGSYDRIRFKVGLDLPASNTNPETLSNHPLAIQSDSFYVPELEKYIFNRITYQRDTSINEVTSIDVADVVIEVVLDYPLEIDLGFDIEIPLKIDYWEWLKGIIFATDPTEIRANIVSNTANAFSIDN